VRLVPVRLPHLHAVAITAALRGGPRVEGPEESGLTHFLEHMVFRGTERHPEPRALMAAFEDAGEEPSAHTSDDEIVISAIFSPDAVARGARLLADVLLRPAFRFMERERRIILEERLEYLDEKGRSLDVDDIARRLVFGKHPLGRSVLGEEADVLRYRRADLERHRRRLVRDGNLAIALAGPVGAPEVEAVSAAFARVPSGEAPGDAAVSLRPGPRIKLVRSPGTPQCEVRLTFTGPGEGDPRAPALQLLAGILDGGPTARLPEQLVDAGFVYDAQAGLVFFSDLSLLEVDLAVSSDRLAATVARALAIVTGLERGVARGELDRARERTFRRRAFSRDDAAAEAAWHARRALLGNPCDRALEARALDRVRASEVTALARRVLRPERFSLVVVGDPAPAERRALERVIARWARRRG
jgi:predicted Zn-dependent peptidase